MQLINRLTSICVSFSENKKTLASFLSSIFLW